MMRFTPGSTFSYTADEPSTDGTGSRPGHDSDSDVRPAAITASGPLPPSENLTLSPGTADGASIPPAVFPGTVDTGTQPPPRRTRTGSTFSVTLTRPSGSAAVTDVGIVSADTVTGLPDDLACAEAADTAAASAPPALIGASGPPSGAPGQRRRRAPRPAQPRRARHRRSPGHRPRERGRRQAQPYQGRTGHTTATSHRTPGTRIPAPVRTTA